MTMTHLRRLALSLALFTLATAMPPAALAKAPLQHTQAPGFYRIALGELEITALSDGTIDLDAVALLAEPATTTTRALARDFAKNPVETSVTAFLVNTGSRLVLVDTGAGVLFGPTLGKLLANLRAAGYTPDQVDDVILSHLHPDHVGGLLEHGAPAFTHATIHAARRDVDFWLSKANLAAAPDAAKPFFVGAAASLTPYVTAGKLVPFDADGAIVPGIVAIATPGHSAGHTSFEVESRGERLMIVGDLIHVAAVQLEQPKVTIAYDADAPAAAQARQMMFTRVARAGELVAAAHLPFPGLGHLRAAGAGWEWLPSAYTIEVGTR